MIIMIRCDCSCPAVQNSGIKFAWLLFALGSAVRSGDEMVPSPSFSSGMQKMWRLRSGAFLEPKMPLVLTACTFDICFMLVLAMTQHFVRMRPAKDVIQTYTYQFLGPSLPSYVEPLSRRQSDGTQIEPSELDDGQTTCGKKPFRISPGMQGCSAYFLNVRQNCWIPNQFCRRGFPRPVYA